MKGRETASGNDTIRAFLPASTITSNVIAEADPSRYPAGNLFPSLAQFKSQFVSYGDDYRLVANSPWLHAGSDGAALGTSLNAPTTPGSPPPPDSNTSATGRRNRQ